jgi:hypothetical protein
LSRACGKALFLAERGGLRDRCSWQERLGHPCVVEGSVWPFGDSGVKADAKTVRKRFRQSLRPGVTAVYMVRVDVSFRDLDSQS